MGKMAETDLYAPVKAWLEARGFEVKAEVGAADVVAVKDGEEPVIIELKTSFSLVLLQQAVARQAVTDAVYVAVPRWKGRAGWKAFSGRWSSSPSMIMLKPLIVSSILTYLPA